MDYVIDKPANSTWCVVVSLMSSESNYPTEIRAGDGMRRKAALKLARAYLAVPGLVGIRFDGNQERGHWADEEPEETHD